MDRMQRDVRFQVCAHGFLLDAGGQQGMLGTLYAFSSIDEVAAWFLDQYGEPEQPQGAEQST